MKLPRRQFLNLAGMAATLIGGSRIARAQAKGRPVMSVTSQLCERIAGTGYANLGAPAITAARRLALDGIAIVVAGTEEEAIHILAAHHKEQGGAAQATAIGNRLPVWHDPPARYPVSAPTRKGRDARAST